MHDIFISYSSKEISIANELYSQLESNVIKVWMAPRDIHPGQSYAEAIILCDENVFNYFQNNIRYF